jgi:pyridoxal phosphate enzyme (YggS family)
MSIASNYRMISDQVAQTAMDSGRKPDDIRIIAVSKGFPVESIREALDANIHLFGENRVQEGSAKIAALAGVSSPPSFHLIGHLQSNKAKEAVRLFDCIHSIDKIDTAQRVDREAGLIGKRQRILVQVNTSGELSKSGCSPDQACALCESISSLHNIELAGLMTIGPLTDNEFSVRASFADLYKLRESIRESTGLPLDELSMGMSGDFKIAIAEGATLLRIGSALFGERVYT